MAKKININNQEIEIPQLNFKAMLIPVFLLLILWIVFAGPFYIVGPEENGVVRTFGTYTNLTESGLQFKFPWPIQTVDLVNVEKVRRLEIGFRTAEKGSTTNTARYINVEDEAMMLTGDENIVSVELVIQYKIQDAGEFLFRVENPQRSVEHAAEAAIRQIVGKNPIDQTLTSGKAAIEIETRDLLQSILSSYKAGVMITQVKLQDVTPPTEVDAAFKDVQSAKEDKEKVINEALGYQNEIIPQARGEAATLIQEAEGFKEKRINEAEGDAQHFEKMLVQYQSAKSITKTRLYLETMSVILPRVEKIIIDGDDVGNVLNMLGSPTVLGGAK
jgi:modulator of FtsH protease HflK